MAKPKIIDGVPVALLALVLWLVTGCSSQAPGQLGGLQSLAKTCPTNGTILDSYIGYDVSGSGRDTAITKARDTAITSIATKVAVCGGHLHIDAFAGSATASTVVYDGDVKPAGATQIAQLRKVPDLVKTTMATIESGITSAARTIPADGSDITSQLGMAAEYADQVSTTGKHLLTVDLLTDGVQTVGVVLNNKTLNTATATDLAKNAPVTSLPPTTTVKISGLGKTSGTPAPTSYVQAIQAFYLAYCHRTGAQSCAAVVDYTA
jgi:hypothetical protein